MEFDTKTILTKQPYLLSFLRVSRQLKMFY